MNHPTRNIPAAAASLRDEEKRNAICWEANQSGCTYDQLNAILSAVEQEDIYTRNCERADTCKSEEWLRIEETNAFLHRQAVRLAS